VNVDLQAGSFTTSTIVLYNASETPTLTITHDTKTGVTGAITVNPAAIDHFTVTGIPSPQSAGALSSPLITAYDPYNNIKTDYTGTIAFTSSDAQAVLPSNYTFIGGDNGQHTFTGGVQLKTAGTQSVTVTGDGRTGSQTGITVNPGAAAKLLWVTQPSSPVVSGIVWEDFSIQVTDAYNNRIASDNTTDITVSPDTGAFGGTTTQTVVAGVATFDDITYPNAGTITVTGNSGALIPTTGVVVTVDAAPQTQGIIWDTSHQQDIVIPDFDRIYQHLLSNLGAQPLLLNPREIINLTGTRYEKRRGQYAFRGEEEIGHIFYLL